MSRNLTQLAEVSDKLIALRQPVSEYAHEMIESNFREHFTIYDCFEFNNKDIELDQLAVTIRHVVSQAPDLTNTIIVDGAKRELIRLRDERICLERFDLDQVTPTGGVKKDYVANYCALLQKQFAFDGRTQLIRFVVFENVKTGTSWFFVAAHHFIMDGIGLLSLLRLIEQCYNSKKLHGRWPDLLPRPSVFDYSQAKENYAYQALSELDLWRKYAPSGASVRTTAKETHFDQDELRRRLHDLQGRPNSEEDYIRGELCFEEVRLSRVFLSAFLSIAQDSEAYSGLDLMLYALREAIAEREQNLWIDLLLSGRFGAFSAESFSRCIADMTEFVPLLLPQPSGELTNDLSYIHARRTEAPHSGMGFRALKRFMRDHPDHDCAEEIGRWQNPRVGLNYRVDFENEAGPAFLNMQPVDAWLGSPGGNRSGNWCQSPHDLGLTITLQCDEISISADYLPWAFNRAEVRSILSNMLTSLERIIPMLTNPTHWS
ncbi:hypothetical protein MK632_17130 [Rhizobium changzhiense]|uniref:hypothetical protein n=1 Tax=Rhizobium changzhiense TaxID=2692317 RepID=UPI001F0BF3B3|nr:hypothetical protein [Rhizobium changzhiense]MCH4547469.1 hypothetical protein [Rhizobium changzhiense]